MSEYRDELLHVCGERDRARSLATRLQLIAQERERLLWLAIGEAELSDSGRARVGREIARHLRDTAFIPGELEHDGRELAAWMRDA